MEYLATSETEVWAPGAVLPLLCGFPKVRNLIATGLDLLELGLAPHSLLQRLASFERIISWYGARREEFRRAVAHLPFVFLDALPPPNGPLHAVDFFAAQVGAPCGLSPRIACCRPEDRKPESWIAIHPFSGSPKKNWPLERFQKLASQLPMPVRFFRGPDDYAPGAESIPDLAELARTLQRAGLCIGNDSGIAHLAAAVGTPVVALFGPTAPEIWAPRGAPVLILRRQPLEALSVEEVAAAVRNWLHQGR